MTEAALSVVIVDDHTLFRKGLAELLERRGGIRVVGVTGTADEAYQLVQERHPDVVLLDLNMPPDGGLTLFERLREAAYSPPAVILTVSEDEEDLAQALRAGVKGYLLKDMEPDDVIEAINRAGRGETVVAPAMTGKLVQLLQSGQSKPDEDLVNLLTPRERQVLAYLAQGASNKAIARALAISHDTVKLHVRHILSKLNLSSRVEAAVFAVAHKISAKAATRQ